MDFRYLGDRSPVHCEDDHEQLQNALVYLTRERPRDPHDPDLVHEVQVVGVVVVVVVVVVVGAESPRKKSLRKLSLRLRHSLFVGATPPSSPFQWRNVWKMRVF